MADCSEVELTFNKTGIWFIEIIAQYRHGWEVGVTEEPPVSEKDAADPMFVSRLQGDVDGDGKYEHVYIRKINILPRPEGQTT